MEEKLEIWSSNLGYPRVGEKRELKKALESYWQGNITDKELLQTAFFLQKNIWEVQKEAGIDFVPVGDFSLYDHMLDISINFGFIPKRFRQNGVKNDLGIYFNMARGAKDTPPLEMTKWFDTNYHYLVPEIDAEPQLLENPLLTLIQKAKSLDIQPKPVLVGPYTFLKLSKASEEKNKFWVLPKLLEVYKEVLKQWAMTGVKWVQIDEPALVLEMSDEEIKVVKDIYYKLSFPDINIMLQTYFEGVSAYQEVVNLPVQGIGLDFVR